MIALAAMLVWSGVADAEGPNGPTSLVAAHWAGSKMVGDPCADAGPDDLCFSVLVRARLQGAVTLSGPAVPKDFSALIWTHGGYTPSVYLVMAVWRGKDGDWHAQRLAFAKPGEPDCVDRDDLKKFGIKRTPTSYRTEDSLCFPLND